MDFWITRNNYTQCILYNIYKPKKVFFLNWHSYRLFLLVSTRTSIFRKVLNKYNYQRSNGVISLEGPLCPGLPYVHILWCFYTSLCGLLWAVHGNFVKSMHSLRRPYRWHIRFSALMDKFSVLCTQCRMNIAQMPCYFETLEKMLRRTPAEAATLFQPSLALELHLRIHSTSLQFMFVIN